MVKLCMYWQSICFYNQDDWNNVCLTKFEAICQYFDNTLQFFLDYFSDLIFKSNQLRFFENQCDGRLEEICCKRQPFISDNCKVAAHDGNRGSVHVRGAAAYDLFDDASRKQGAGLWGLAGIAEVDKIIAVASA